MIAVLPLFSDLSDAERADLEARSALRTLAAGNVLFYEGDKSDQLYVLVKGRCAASFAGQSKGEICAPALLDPIATLGGLPHSVKITATESCELLIWSMETLWASLAFSAAARRFLALELQQTQTRLDEVAAPIHYAPNSAQLIPGPFLFEDTTLIFAFCEAEKSAVQACIPPGLSLLQIPGGNQAPIFLGLAKFPNAHPEHDPAARFSYTETTYFIPVRHGADWGLFIPYIYPSIWEPILLGREIYGFPKRLGETIFEPNDISLRVDEVDYLRLQWESSDSVSESRLVGALMDWLGIQGQVAALAFQAGEVIRKMARLPAHRRVDVFNRKQILAVETDHKNPVYAVDQLTRAAFGVLRWYQIARIRDPQLTVTGGPFSGANLTIREAYRTQLDMRLSVGRVVKDYNQP